MKPIPRKAQYRLHRTYRFPAIVLSSLLLLTACSDSNTSEPTDTDDTTDPVTDIVTDAEFDATDWTEETHGNDVDPNFEEVFDDTQVKRLDFVVTQERWQSMLSGEKTLKPFSTSMDS